MEKARIGIINGTINMLDLLLAKDAGLYAKHDVDVEFDFIAGLRSIEALRAGDLDVVVSVGATIRAIMNDDAPLKIVQLIHHNGPHWVMGRPGVTSVLQLKGGKVQAGDKGTEPDVMVRKWLTANGLKPDEDVELTYEKSHADWTDDGPAPEEDGAIARTLEREVLEAKGFTPLIELCTDYPDTLIHGLTVTEQTLAERPQMVAGLIKAHKEVSQWIDDGHPTAIKFIQDSWGASAERAKGATEFLKGVFVSRLDEKDFGTVIASSAAALAKPPITVQRLLATVSLD
jgi:ABC-type nitrate/sulfonate/bicarbonate transport system substrate-binding protein